MNRDEHGGDVEVTSGNVTRFPAYGCSHCPAAFFSNEGHYSHQLERHPDKPHAEVWPTSPNHYVTYFPDVDRRTPHMYILSSKRTQKPISNLVVDHTGEISGIETHPKKRRKGLATELLNAAKEHSEGTPGVPEPKFSPTRTPAGDKFQKAAAKKLGGEAPTSERLISPRSMRGMIDFRRLN